MHETVLKSVVVIGYPDISNAGCRALLGLNEEEFEISPLLLNVTDDNPRYLSVNNCDFQQLQEFVQICSHKTKDISFIIINTYIATTLSHVIASEIINTVASCGSVKELIILSALPTVVTSSYLKFSDEYPSNPKIFSTDPFLNSLLQFSKVESFTTSVIVAEGKRPKDSMSNLQDGSQQAIESLIYFLKSELKIDVDFQKSLSWVSKMNASSFNADSLMYI